MKNEKIRRLLGLARRARGVFIGSRDTRGAVRRGEVRLILLAEDGSPRDRERVRRVAAESRVPVRVVTDREELGSWVGRGPVAVLGVRDRELVKAMLEALPDETEEKENGGQKT